MHFASGELYDLVSDVGEKTNLAAAKPDVVQRLRAHAEAMVDDLGITGIGPGCRELGRGAGAVPTIGRDGRVRPDAAKVHRHLS